MIPKRVYLSENEDSGNSIFEQNDHSTQISFPEKIPAANLITDPGKNELDSFPAIHFEFEILDQF